MIRLSRDDFNLLKKRYKENGIPFEIHYNNMSAKLVDKFGFKHYTGDDISYKHMGFIRKVKCHVERQIKSGKLVPDLSIKEKANYFDIGRLRKKPIKDCIEIDLDSAYWETAYKLGIISKQLYEEPKKMEADLESRKHLLSKNEYEKEKKTIKKIRLMSLGVLAKKTTIYDFDGITMKRRPGGPIVNKETEYFWNKICSHVSTVMTTISADIPSSDYLFYWVDAIFVRKRSASRVCELMKEMGYKYKIKPIKEVRYTDTQIFADDRPFILSSRTKMEDILK